LRIEWVGPAETDRLEPLWLQLHAHHQEVAPELAPYVSDARSWSVRRALYSTILLGRGFALVARENEIDIGYLVASVEPAPWPATFVSTTDVAELVTLAVRPESRGRGVGTELLAAMDVRLESEAISDSIVGVVASNSRAINLYRSRGFAPAWLTLTRFGRPPRPHTNRTIPVNLVAPAAVDYLRPLWLTLHDHHRRVAPGLAPYLSDGDSWNAVRGLLEAAARDRLLVRVGPSHAPLGMACATITRDDPYWTDTWLTGQDIGEIHFVVVADEARRLGIGTVLLTAIDARLSAAGAVDQVAGVIEPNHDATRFYQGHGFLPAWLRLSRFLGSSAAPSSNQHGNPRGTLE